MRLCPRFSHKRATLHSPFPAPCGSRGKHRSPQLQTLPLFQDSRIPQPQFRNPRTTPTPPITITSDGFPLFLQQLRVLLSFLLISYPFPTTRRAPSALNAKPHKHSPHTKPPNSFLRPRQVIQRRTPVFHARSNERMNTIKKNKRQPFPRATGVM